MLFLGFLFCLLILFMVINANFTLEMEVDAEWVFDKSL